MELNTTKDLCDFIATNYPNEVSGDTTGLDAAVWFCCMQQAKDLSGLGLKDLARMIQHGMTTYNGREEEAVQQWLANFNEDLEVAIENEDEYTTLEELLEEFYVVEQ